MFQQDCQTSYQNECRTVNEQQCRTVPEQQCTTVNEQDCQTTYESQCSTVNEQVCQTVQKQVSVTYVDNVLLTHCKPSLFDIRSVAQSQNKIARPPMLKSVSKQQRKFVKLYWNQSVKGHLKLNVGQWKRKSARLTMRKSANKSSR